MPPQKSERCCRGHVLSETRYANSRNCRECVKIRGSAAAGRVGRPRSEYCAKGHLMAETRILLSNGDSICRLCRNARSSEYGRARRRKEGRTRFVKDSEIKKRYGLPYGTYDSEFAKQGGLCAICHRESPGRDLQIDHCHVSGKFRALLCVGCNTALGLLKEDKKTIESMLAYIGKHHVDRG